MATRVGAIFIDFFANTAKLKADLGKADRAVKSSSARMNRALAVVEKAGRRLGRSFGRLGKSVFSLKVGIATLVGTAGLGLLVKRSLDTADAIAKVADLTGFTTDQIQELGFAAQQAGVGQKTLNLALQRFSRRVKSGEKAAATQRRPVTAGSVPAAGGVNDRRTGCDRRQH